jgi:ribosomal protein L15
VLAVIPAALVLLTATSNQVGQDSLQALSLNELFPEGGTVGVEELVAKGAVRGGRPVKVLGSGDISVALDVSAHAFSASAKEKIAAAGGSTTEL